MHSAKICSAGPTTAKPDVSESEIGGSGISRGSDELDDTATVEPEDCRTLLIRYLENLGPIIYTKVRWSTLKYILLYQDLYRRTIDGLLLRCLGSDHFKVSMESS
jgi:hypothetical protein